MPVVRKLANSKYIKPVLSGAKRFSQKAGKKISDWIQKNPNDRTPRQLKTIRKLTKRKREHVSKLKQFQKNPYKFDNKGHLRKSPVPQRVIDGRVKHLKNEIKNFDRMIDKVKKE